MLGRPPPVATTRPAEKRSESPGRKNPTSRPDSAKTTAITTKSSTGAPCVSSDLTSGCRSQDSAEELREASIGLDETDDAQAAHDEAVQPERPEGLGCEEAHEEPHREIGGDPGDHAAHEGLTPNAVPEG